MGWADLIENVGAEFVETYVLNSNLNNVKYLNAQDFCKVMCKFVTEV